MLKLIEQEGVQEDTRQFSLEKDGRQIGTAQCQGNTVCSFQLDVPWDREDYAKYFLKQLLHRLDVYQGGEVRLSPELPERELFCELGFVPWEGGWVRRQHRQLHSLDFSHELMGACIRPGDLAVDATAGNGGDTEFLCRLVGEQGRDCHGHSAPGGKGHPGQAGEGGPGPACPAALRGPRGALRPAGAQFSGGSGV